MNQLAILFIASIFITQTQAAVMKQFPVDGYNYQPRVDTGMSKYRNKSLRNSKKLVLTFDDGPHNKNTPIILDLLKEYNVKATFFVLTEKINESNKYIINRIINEGHFLASHDHDHDNNNNESETTFKSELTKTIKAIEQYTDDLGFHQREMYYRFPYGAYGKHRLYHHMNVLKEVSQELYGENCINFAFWDIDTSDWVSNMTPENVSQNVTSNMEGGTAYTFKKKTDSRGRSVWRKHAYNISNPIGGGVVLLHDIHDRTVKAVKLILENAVKKKWEIIPYNQVQGFDYTNKTCVLK